MRLTRWAMLAACFVVHEMIWAAPILAQTPQASGLHQMASGDSQGVRVCPCEKCQASRRTFIDRQLQKLADMAGRRSQLPQHVAYDSPLESSYYFRPYVPRDIEKQREFMGLFKNPYDNRMFDSLYDSSSQSR